MPQGKPTETYEVVGVQPVLGRAKGDTISSDEISPEQAERLLDGGAIARPGGSPAPDPKKPDPVAPPAGPTTPPKE